MTREIAVTIDPKVTNGTQLAANISDWRQAVLSLHQGTARPVYAVVGTLWIDTASSPWKLCVFDGARDVLLGRIDAKAHHFAGADASTPRPVVAGGTGASTVGDARHNLGLGEGDSPGFKAIRCGAFVAQASGTTLRVSYNGTAILTLDSSGNLTLKGDVTAFGATG